MYLLYIFLFVNQLCLYFNVLKIINKGKYRGFLSFSLSIHLLLIFDFWHRIVAMIAFISVFSCCLDYISLCFLWLECCSFQTLRYRSYDWLKNPAFEKSLYDFKLIFIENNGILVIRKINPWFLLCQQIVPVSALWRHE